MPEYWHFAFGAGLTWAGAIGLGCYFLVALTAVIEEHGWKMELTCETA